MIDNKRYKLKVVSGLHKNAEITICAGENYSVGSSDACDIIFMDPGIEGEHLFIYVNEDDITIVKNCDNIFIDGNIVNEESETLKDYEVVSIGDAQFAVGSSDAEWPTIKPSEIVNERISNARYSLLPMVLTQDNNDLKYRITKKLKKLVTAISKMERKITVGIGIFIFIFLIFWVDFLQSGTHRGSCDNLGSSVNGTEAINNKSLILSINSFLGQIRDSGLIGAGVEEPSLEIDKENEIKIDPMQKVKDYLAANWEKSMIENIKNEYDIEYIGRNRQNQCNLVLDIKKEIDGTFFAEGFTMTKDQRERFVSRLGDVLRVKVLSAEGIKEICKRIMVKNKIENPEIKVDIIKKTVVLEGETNYLCNIPQTGSLVSTTFDNMRICNNIRYAPEELNIIGANTIGLQYIKLDNGSKVFRGGTLKNGCIIEDIKSDKVQLNCSGTKVVFKLGEKS